MLAGVEKLSSTELAHVQSVIDSIVRKSLDVRFVDTVAKAQKVQHGEIAILDDGAGAYRLYVRTGKGTVVYFTGT